jgi:hypothetical protein
MRLASLFIFAVVMALSLLSVSSAQESNQEQSIPPELIDAITKLQYDKLLRIHTRD